MNNSQSKAINEIVSELSKVTGHDTNFIDVDGRIIASTNANRIGNIHHGAQKILEENLDELYISPDSEDAGTKAGLNLPLYVADKIIGIIGITGYYEEVFPYARLVKRISEILMADSIQKQKEMDREYIIHDFLHSWILGEGIAEGEFFINRAQLLGININILRRMLIIYYEDISTTELQNNHEIRNKTNQKIKQYFAKFNDTYSLISNNLIYITMPAYKDNHLRDISNELLNELKTNKQFNIYIGIDGSESGSSILSIPLLQAKQAYKAAILNKEPIFFNKDITIEGFVENTNLSQKKSYINKIFPEYEKESIPHFMKVIEAWFDTDGSVRNASEMLFMHKNTYQYQIKRIYNCSGYDLRKPKSAPIFYIALLFYRDLSRFGYQEF